MTIESTIMKVNLTFQGVTENNSDTDICIDSCKAIGALNSEYLNSRWWR